MRSKRWDKNHSEKKVVVVTERLATQTVFGEALLNKLVGRLGVVERDYFLGPNDVVWCEVVYDANPTRSIYLPITALDPVGTVERIEFFRQ